MKKIKILHCLETIGSGGVEQRRLLLAERLDPDRYEQKIVCTKAIGSLPEKFRKANCEVIEIGELKRVFSPKQYLRTLRVARSFRPDIIHGAVFEGVLTATIAGKLGRVRCVIGEETSDAKQRSWRGNLLFKSLCAMMDRVIAVSPVAYDYLIKTINIPQSKALLINNGVRQAAEAPQAQIDQLRKDLAISGNETIIVTVSRLFDQYKKTSDIIKAMAIVTEQANARLVIVGDGPDMGKLQDLAKELKLEQQVIFAGYQENPQPYYAISDIFCLASASESFGLVLVEAMFQRLPIVATRAGGIPYIVEDNATGLLVPPHCPQELASSILRLCQDKELRETMGHLGMERAQAHFSEERYVKDVENTYLESLKIQ